MFVFFFFFNPILIFFFFVFFWGGGGGGGGESILMFTLDDVWPLLHTDLILWCVEFYEPIYHGRGDEKADV